MNGAVVAVLVEKGQQVKAGATLVVMEAMKMENQVLADRKGVIESISVNVGDAVLQGDKLLNII